MENESNELRLELEGTAILDSAGFTPWGRLRSEVDERQLAFDEGMISYNPHEINTYVSERGF